MSCTSKQDTHPHIGDVYMMDFYGKGSAQSGFRPGIIIQNDIGNQNSPNVIAIPLTSSLKKMHMPTHVFLPAEQTGLRVDSVAICESPMSIPKENIGVFVTTISKFYMKEIAVAFLLEHPMLGFLSKNEIYDVQKRSETLIAG